MILRRFDLSSFRREIKTFLYKWNYTTEEMVNGLCQREGERQGFWDNSLTPVLTLDSCLLCVCVLTIQRLLDGRRFLFLNRLFYSASNVQWMFTLCPSISWSPGAIPRRQRYKYQLYIRWTSLSVNSVPVEVEVHVEDDNTEELAEHTTTDDEGDIVQTCAVFLHSADLRRIIT